MRRASLVSSLAGCHFRGFAIISSSTKHRQFQSCGRPRTPPAIESATSEKAEFTDKR